MKKLVVLLIVAGLSLSSIVYASGSSTTCATKNPIVLVHGMGASATISLFGVPMLQYWYHIPEALGDNGAAVYVTSVNGMDSTANKAAALKAQILQILASTGKTKVNLICHSHGTIYARYMISNLGMSSKVASYTSISGPHRGSVLADAIMYGFPSSVKTLIAGTLNIVYAFIFGDTNPNSLQNGYDVTTNYMINTFNPNTPDKAGIYYQSYGAKIKTVSQSVIMGPSWLAILALGGGANDGLVPVTSAQWTNYKGTIEGAWYCTGIDHVNMVNQILGVYVGWSATDFYVGIAKDLKARGF